MSDDEHDKITESPDDQVDDDEMSPAEAGFAKGEADAEESEETDDEIY